MTNKPILLVGCGKMAIAYAKVLAALSVPFDVIGRGSASCEAFKAETGVAPRSGGIGQAIKRGRVRHEVAIAATPIDQLAIVTQHLINADVHRILVEKPGGLNIREIAKTAHLAEKRGAQVFVAYNRRFYASVKRARELIESDGGVTSFCFEFTEWSHDIAALPLSAAIKREWFLANSSHVCDLAFFLGGFPTSLTAHSRGALDWHPDGAQFTGCGIGKGGALFSYHSNWESAGRWGVELCTPRRRLHLRPLEKLQEQMRGALELNIVPLDDQFDRQFKPGLYMQTRTFLANSPAAYGLLNLIDHANNASKIYRRIAPHAAIRRKA